MGTGKAALNKRVLPLHANCGRSRFVAATTIVRLWRRATPCVGARSGLRLVNPEQRVREADIIFLLLCRAHCLLYGGDGLHTLTEGEL